MPGFGPRGAAPLGSGPEARRPFAPLQLVTVGGVARGAVAVLFAAARAAVVLFETARGTVVGFATTRREPVPAEVRRTEEF